MTRSVNSNHTNSRLVLGINCALAPYGISLIQVDENGASILLVEQSIHTKGSAIEDLVFVIEEMCQKVEKQLSDIDVIGILNGPGAYTAMRLSLTVVKTIVQLYSTTLVGLSTLEHLVWGFRGKPGVYISVFHARGDQYNAALFGVEKRKLKRLTDDFLWTESEIRSFFKKEQGHITCVGKLPYSIETQLDQFETIDYIPGDIHARFVAMQSCQPEYLNVTQHLDVYYPTTI